MRLPVDPAIEPYTVQASSTDIQRSKQTEAAKATGLPAFPGFSTPPAQLVAAIGKNVLETLPGLGNLAGQVIKLVASPQGVGMWLQAQAAPLAISGPLMGAVAPVLDLISPALVGIPYAGPVLSGLAKAGAAIGTIAGPLFGTVGAGAMAAGQAIASSPDPIAALTAGAQALARVPPPSPGTQWGCIFEGCAGTPPGPAGAVASSGLLSALPPLALPGIMQGLAQQPPALTEQPTTAGATPSVPGVTQPIRRPTP